MGEITQVLLGEAVSASTVSSLCKQLDAQVRALHSRPIVDDLLYLYLDGVSLKIKRADGVVKRILLVVMGISVTGRKRIVDFRLVRRETKEHWQAFLEQFYLRGLHGSQLACVCSDGNAGLIAALEVVYPAAPRQRCWVHKMRNVTNKLKQTQRAAAQAGMVKIYSAEHRRAAIDAFEKWDAEWHPKDAQAADCLKRDLEQVLTIFTLPKAHRMLLRTSNPLERVFVELHRRARLILAFVNDASAERISLSVFNHLQTTWDRKPLPAITQKT